MALVCGSACLSPLLVGREPNQPTWNPVLFATGKGTLRLWYKGGPSPMTWTGFVRTSTDGGGPLNRFPT